MSPAVSVIIPTFNRAVMLQEAIESVFAQGHDDLEIVVIDDGSTDTTREMVAATYAGDERIRYHYQANAGASAARNAGLDLSRGDYIAFLDSDDAWQPWHLALQLAGLGRYPEIGFIWTNMDAVNSAGEVIASSALATLLSAYSHFSMDDLFSMASPLVGLGIELPAAYRGRKLYVGDVFSAMVVGNLVLPSSVVMRRGRLDVVGRFDGRFATGEDYEFFLRACRAGPVGYADIPSVRYRMGTEDRLSGPSMALPIARNYLEVLEETLARDADRISLPTAMIRAARADAHQWVAETELLSGSVSSARKHLVAANRIRLRPRSLAALVATLLPAPVLQLAIRSLRRLRSLLRRPRATQSGASSETRHRRD